MRVPDASPRSCDTARIASSQLIARIAEAFPLVCPGCGGDIRLTSFNTDPTPIRRIFTHLGATLEPLPLEVRSWSADRLAPNRVDQLVQAHDDRDAIQAAPDKLPVIDIHAG